MFWVIAVMMRRKDVQEGESELCQPHMHMIYLEKRYTGDCRQDMKAVILQTWGALQDRAAWAGYSVLLYGVQESGFSVRSADA